MSRKPTAWSFTVRDMQPPLTVYERPERGNQVYLRWVVGRSHARPKLRGLETVRGASGHLDPTLVGRALELALAQYRQAATESAARSEAPESGPLTLRDGLALALRIPHGLYPARTASWNELVRSSGRVQALLGPDRTWVSLSAASVGQMWRDFAEAFLESGEGGHGAAVEMVKALSKVSRWLAEAGQLPHHVPLPRGWEARLRADWASMTGNAAVRRGPSRPRYTPGEMVRIWSGLDRAAPPLALLLSLAGEWRGGQALRSHRSHLTLGTGGAGFGELEVLGGGERKPGGIVALSAAQRADVDRALSSGYLADLEAAYRSGALSDYPLFPALRNGAQRVPAKRGLRPMNRSHLQQLMRDYEDALGIPHVPQRLMHGLRRAFADAVVQADVDPSVQDAAAGWTPGSGTRERVYRDAERARERREAARIRTQVRGGLAATGPMRPAVGALGGGAGAPAAHPASAPSSAEPSEEGA